MPFFNIPGGDGSGTNSFPVLQGDGAPSDSIGADGQLYIDRLNGVLFVKDAGTWGGGISVGIDEWSELNGKPAEFPPSAHGHVIADVDQLQAALDGKATATHSHVIADVSGLDAALSGKADAIHTHEIAAVNGLQTALDNLAAGGAGVAWSDVPATPTTTAAAGSIAYNSSTLFVAVAANTWKRLALTDWVVSSITITQQPADQTASGGAATFTVAATVSGGGAVTYQWQSSLDAGTTWSNISGATTDTLALNGLQISDDGTQYRAVVSATGTASVPSAAATLTVTVSPSGDNLQAESGDILQTEAGEWLQHDGIFATPTSSAVWTQRGEIVTRADTPLEHFGYAVRTTPNGLAMVTGTTRFATGDGFLGLVRVLDWKHNSWIQRGADITGNVAFDGIKYQLFPARHDSIAISALGSIVAVSGEKYDTNIPNLQSSDVSAWVRTYSWTGANWQQRGQDIEHAHSSGTVFALSDDGLHLVCGIPGSLSPAASGEAKAYRWNGSNWELFQTLTGGAEDTNFGRTLAIGNSAKRLAIASSATVRIYERPTTESFWSLAQTIPIEGVQGADEITPPVRQLAWSDTDANTLVIATPYETVGSVLGAGRVRVYDDVGGVYTQRGDALNGTNNNDAFGSQVSISKDGLTLVVAKPRNWINFGPAGSVEVFEWIDNQWINKATFTGLEGADAFGASLDASADCSIVVIGAPYANMGASIARYGYVRVMQLQPRHLELPIDNYSGLIDVWAPGIESVTLVAPANQQSYDWQFRISESAAWQNGNNLTDAIYSGNQLVLPPMSLAPFWVNYQYRCVINGFQPLDHVRLFAWRGSDSILKAETTVVPSFVQNGSIVVDVREFLNWQTRVWSGEYFYEYKVLGNSNWQAGSRIYGTLSFPNDYFLIKTFAPPAISNMTEWRIGLKADAYEAIVPVNPELLVTDYDQVGNVTETFYTQSVIVDAP